MRFVDYRCGKWTDKITAAGEGTDVISSAGVIDGG